MSKKDKVVNKSGRVNQPSVFVLSRVRIESMQSHLKQVLRDTVMLNDLLEETTEDNRGLQPHDLAELLEAVQSLENACLLLVRWGRTLAHDRVQAMTAPEYQQ